MLSLFSQEVTCGIKRIQVFLAINSCAPTDFSPQIFVLLILWYVAGCEVYGPPGIPDDLHAVNDKNEQV